MHMPRIRPAVPAAVLLAVALTAAGCSPSQDTDPVPPPPPAGPQTPPGTPGTVPAGPAPEPVGTVDFAAFSAGIDGWAMGAGGSSLGFLAAGTYEVGLLCIGATGREKVVASVSQGSVATGAATGPELHRLEGTCGRSPAEELTTETLRLTAMDYFVRVTASEGTSAAVRLDRTGP